MSSLSNEALLIQIAQANQSALEALYRRLQPQVFAFGLQFLSSDADAEDVVTETFMEVWRHAGRFAGQSKVSTWVLGIARHKALDKVRKRESQSLVDIDWDDLAESLSADDESAYDRIARRQVAEHLHKCMSKLPVEQRECVHLVFYNDLGLAEVAELQGIPENTVKTRLFHARRKLREMLESGAETPASSLPTRKRLQLVA